MSDKLREEKGVVLGEHALVKHQQELATVGPESLNGVRIPRWKEPQVSCGDIAKEHGSIGIQHANAGVSILHVGPFVCRVPMELPKTSCVEPHVYAGKLVGGRQLALRD